jgi:hypothetical protein
MNEPKKKRDEDEVTIARSIFDEIVEDTESEDFDKGKRDHKEDEEQAGECQPFI